MKNTITKLLLLALAFLSTVSYAQPGECSIACPDDITVNLTEYGETSATVDYEVEIVGECLVINEFDDFAEGGPFDPSSIIYYQTGTQSLPTPFANDPFVFFNGGQTTLTIVSSDFDQAANVNLWFFNGVEWIAPSAGTVSFDWSYSTLDGPFFDRFYALVGDNTDNFSNTNFNGAETQWDEISDQNAGLNQAGSYSVAIPAGGRIALSAWTFDFGFGAATIVISNFNFTSVPLLADFTLDQTSGLASGSDFPIGTTVNTFELLDEEDTVVDECSFSITVNAPPPCVIQCPADVTVNLLPGECSSIVSYAVTSSGACPGGLEAVWSNADTTTSLGFFTTVSCGFGFPDPTMNFYYQVYQAPSGDRDVAFARIGIPPEGATTLATHTVRLYTLNNTSLPYNVTAANRTFLGASAAVNIPPGSAGQKMTVPFPPGIVVPGGSRILMEVEASWSYTVDAAPGSGANTWLASPPCGISPDFPITMQSIGFAQDKLMLLYLNFDAIPELVDGIESGGTFPIGTTMNCYQIVGDQGEVVSECCFDVTVLEYPNPIAFLGCNDLVQISLDENCSAVVGADLILEGGPYGCYDDYIVSIAGYPGAVLNENAIGQYLNVTVTDPATGNSCWGQIYVEDKLPPVIECNDLTLNCGESLVPVFGSASGVTSASVSPGLSIGPDFGTITTSPLAVASPAPGLLTSVTDVNVTLDLNHTWVGDLNIVVTAPSGESVTLFNQMCAFQADLSFTIDDEAGTALSCANSNSGGTFSSGLGGGLLAGFDGATVEGEWVMTITDNAFGDAGVLNNWSLQISYSAVSAVTASDNCSIPELDYVDFESGDVCESFLIQRVWTATDESGNTASCIQNITVLPLTLADIECPLNYEGDCGDPTDPIFTGGYPTINGNPIVEGGVCNVFVGYWDKPLADCGNGTKIIRTWTILDWCSQEVVECIQIIKLIDDEGPWLDCPEDYTVGSDPWFCNADVYLQVPYALDHCGTPYTLTPSVSAGVLIHFIGNIWRVDNLPVGTHTVTWTAVDDCENDNSCSYEITVVDDVPPVPICDEHTILALTFDNGLDEGLTKIFAETFDDGSHDNCGPVTFLVRRMDSCIDFDWIGPPPLYGEYPNNDGGQPESLDRGLTFQEWVPFACCDVGQTIMVELRVTDLYGNINSCMVEVEVQDKLPPLIICPPDITVSCEFWFDAHETDGFEPFDGLESVFGRVLDAYEYSEFDREWIIINDPGNFDLPQPYHWGLDGWADDNCDITIDIRTRIFDDCSAHDLPGDAPQWAVRLVERTFRAQDAQGNTSTCRQRIWVVDFDPFYIEDEVCGLNNADDVRWPCDLVLTDCPQGELTPENLSEYAPNNRPIVNDDNCSIIGVSYEDQIFYFVDNACYKIVRTWTVIDWCQFETDGEGGHYGYWTYVQVIKVHDHDGAEFLNCPDGPLTYCVTDSNVVLPDNNQVFLGESNPNSSACSVHVWESRTVYETCSDHVIYDVKIYPYNHAEYVQIVAKTTVTVDSNGHAILTWDTRQNSLPSNHPIRRYGLPYNDRLCSNWPFAGGEKDYHRVLWSVEDGCGNLSTCEYLFRLEDCKKPTPICVGLSSVVMPSSGSVTIWAADFDSGSSVDDCTSHDYLLFSFSGTTYQPSRVFDCDAIAANGSPSFLVEIWVADEGNDLNCSGRTLPLVGVLDTTGIQYNERNKDFCTTFIVIDDNEDVCDPGAGLGGAIETEELDAVALVTVTLTDPANGNVFGTYTTTQDGIYRFINPLLNGEISSSRNDDHKNGVSTLDLVKIQKHLLGIQLLDSPYKLIAADANNSESVSALDLVEIRKLILGLYTEFPKSESWRFVNSTFEFADPSSPWPFEETVSVEGLTMGHDFVGVKVGDVNGNVVANATQVQVRNAKGVLEFSTDVQTVVAGQTITVPVSAKNFAQILGYQFTMKTAGLDLTGVEAGALDMSAENIGVHNGAITVSWNKVSPVSSSDVLFTLTFTATESGDLSKMLAISTSTKLTEAEAYNGKEEILDVALSFNSGVVAGKDFALFQNEPNPFEGNTVIGFTLPEAMDATVTVYDVTGKVVHMIEGSYAQGYNEIKVNRKDLAATGVMYYRLDANDFTATKKMVVID